MARDGLTEIISSIRLNSGLGTAEYSIDGVSYWGDNQIQTLLDNNVTEYLSIPIYPEGKYSGGSTAYTHIPLASKIVEGSESGSLYFNIETLGGSVLGTVEYTVYPLQGRVALATSYYGLLYVTYRGYNLEKVYGDMWQSTANYYHRAIDFAQSDQKYSLSQKYDHARENAKRYSVGGVNFKRLRAT